MGTVPGRLVDPAAAVIGDRAWRQEAGRGSEGDGSTRAGRTPDGRDGRTDRYRPAALHHSPAPAPAPAPIMTSAPAPARAPV